MASVAKTGRYRYDPKTRKLVLYSTKIPRSVTILGEVVSCAPSGETLHFERPIHVADAAEKRRVLNERGLMPTPKGFKARTKAERQADIDRKVPSFAEFFKEQNGVPLSECAHMVKGIKDEKTGEVRSLD